MSRKVSLRSGLIVTSRGAGATGIGVGLSVIIALPRIEVFWAATAPSNAPSPAIANFVGLRPGPAPFRKLLEVRNGTTLP